MYPIHNHRVIGKAIMPNFDRDDITAPHKDQLEHMLKQKLAIGFASEFLKDIDVKKIGAVGNEFEIEYVMEAYVFTREQLDMLIDAAKKSVQEKI